MSKSRDSQIDNDKMVWPEGVEDVSQKSSSALTKQKREDRAEVRLKNALKTASSSATSSSAPSYILPSPSDLFLRISNTLDTLEAAITGIEPFIRSNKQNKISDKYQPPIANIKDNFTRIKDLFKNMQREGHSKNYEDFLVFTNEIEGKSTITFLEDIKSACAELKHVSRNLFKDKPEILRELEGGSHNFQVYIKTLRDALTQKFNNEKKAKLQDQEFTSLETANEIVDKINTWKETKEDDYVGREISPNFIIEACRYMMNEISNSSMEEILISHLEAFIKLLIHFCEQQNKQALEKLTVSDAKVSASSIFSPTSTEKAQAAVNIEANNLTIGNLFVLLELTQWKDCKLDDIAKTLNANIHVYPDNSTKGLLQIISDDLNKRLKIEKNPNASASSSFVPSNLRS